MDDKSDSVELTPAEESELTPKPTPEEIPSSESNKPVVTFRGNGYDLSAVVAATIGGAVLLSCITCNMAYYILPFIPIVLGIVGLVAAKDSVDPERTKLLSWLGLGSGAFFLLVGFLCVLAYMGFFFFMFFAAAAENGGF